jgi:hypothetical protein
MRLADLPLATFLDEPPIPYEEDEVTRPIFDVHDVRAFAPWGGGHWPNGGTSGRRRCLDAKLNGLINASARSFDNEASTASLNSSMYFGRLGWRLW